MEKNLIGKVGGGEETKGDILSDRYAKIRDLVFDGKLDLNGVEAIVLSLVSDMKSHGMISGKKQEEIESLILEIIGEPDYPVIVDGTFEVKGD